MRIIIGLIVLAALIGACTAGEPGPQLSERTLGDETEQIDITAEIYGPDDSEYRGPEEPEDQSNFTQIAARLGVSACGTRTSADAEGNCDIPEELLCDSNGKRECPGDCEEYLKGDGSCLMDEIESLYPDKEFADINDYCFEEVAHYEAAKGCLSESTDPECVIQGGRCRSYSCDADEYIGSYSCPYPRYCCMPDETPTCECSEGQSESQCDGLSIQERSCDGCDWSDWETTQDCSGTPCSGWENPTCNDNFGASCGCEGNTCYEGCTSGFETSCPGASHSCCASLCS